MALTKTPIELSSTPSIVDGGNATAITIDSSENVGIGTVSPSYLVHADATTSTDPSYFVASSGSDFVVAMGSQNSPGVAQEAFIGTISNDTLKIKTNNTERMRIDASGNVGINQTNPAAFNSLGGTQVVIGDGASTAENITLYSNTYGHVAFAVSNVSSSTGQYAGLIQYYHIDNTMRLYTSSTERMRIDSSGNLLVGTTSSSGTSGQGIKLNKVSYDGILHIVGATTTTAQDAIQVYSTGAGAYRFFVQYNGQVNATSSSINAISDASLKENIRDLDKGLETILALQPRRFDWKNGDGNDIMGFVAQEVETVLPELVHDYKYSEEETKLGLKMGDMIPSLVKAIQEQQATITALEARIAQLENT